MKCSTHPSILVLLFSVAVNAGANDDRFNFDQNNDDRDFGPDDWDKVRCDDPDQCIGFPDPWSNAVGWDQKNTNKGCEVCVDNEVKNNNCKSCPQGSSCGQTRQSPIELFRDRGLYANPNSKECPDWHRMKYMEGACTWDDLVDNDNSIHRNNFLIRRHALQILTPVDEKGELQCKNASPNDRRFPRLDFSKGFPNFFLLAHTEISVPSQHTQEGKRYDAEVSLAHFYEAVLPKNQLGKVNVFLEIVQGVAAWPFLDKLICQWRETEEQVRKECGLRSVEAFYPGCSNYKRGHAPSPPAAPVAPVSINLAPSTSSPTLSSGKDSLSPATTKSPSSLTGRAYQPKYYPTCHVCGAANLRVSNSNITIYMPSFPNMTCNEFQDAGFAGIISPNLCDIFPAFLKSCNCTVAQPWNLTTPSSNQNKSIAPSPFPTTPPAYDCPSFSNVDTGIDVNYARMCNTCCDPDLRSDTDFCHDAYSFFNNKMPSVCYHCCTPPMIMAPEPVTHPTFKRVDCSDVENPHRMCNEKTDTSCCREERSTTKFCTNVYKTFGDLVDSICWYCCDTPRMVGPSLDYTGNRRLRAEANGITPNLEWPKADTDERRLELLRKISEREEDESLKLERFEALRHSNADARVRFLKVEPGSNVKVDSNGDENDEEHFRGLMEHYLENEYIVQDEDERSRRRLDNYDDVTYFSYEWLLKVRTEYYFRYEGTQTVPPCKDQVHFRVMKDPIQVPERQVNELQRLLAERIAPKDSEFKSCEPDHAGAPRKDSPGKFDFVRPLQENHKLHRMVFCECKDWKSLFVEDRQWCRQGINTRFYDHPYNYPSEAGKF